MALILNLETASSVCSVALSRNGITLADRESSADKSHATQMTLLIQELLSSSGVGVAALDAISLSLGPGSYTGLRIGASVAKGLSYGSGKPVIGIQTLKALASGALVRHPHEISRFSETLPVLLCPMLDARRMEVYTAVYSTTLEEILPVQAMIIDGDSFSALLDTHIVCFFGTGGDKVSGIIKHPNARFLSGLPLAASFQSALAETGYQSGEFLDTAYFEPHYLKEFIASIPKNKVLG